MKWDYSNLINLLGLFLLSLSLSLSLLSSIPTKVRKTIMGWLIWLSSLVIYARVGQFANRCGIVKLVGHDLDQFGGGGRCLCHEVVDDNCCGSSSWSYFNVLGLCWHVMGLFFSFFHYLDLFDLVVDFVIWVFDLVLRDCNDCLIGLEASSMTMI